MIISDCKFFICSVIGPYAVQRAGMMIRASIYLLLPCFLLAQSESRISYFRGGHVEMRSQVSMAGPGPLMRQEPGDTVACRFNPAHNPVFLMTDPGNGIVIQAGLPVSLNLSSLAGINERVETGMDDALAPYREADAVVTYPRADVRLKTAMPVSKVELTLGMRRYHVAAIWEHLIGMSSRSRMTGMELRASTPTESGGNPSDVILNARFNGFFDYDFRLQRAGAILAFPLIRGYSIGVQAARLFAHFRAGGQAFIDATMLYSGSEYAFNDPGALWPNSLDQHLVGRFNGQSMQYRIGLSRRGDHAIYEFMMDTGAFLQCRGEMRILQYTIPAFRLDALLDSEADVEILDASQLNLSQLTRTEPIPNTTYNTIRLAIPAAFQIGYMRWNGAFLWYAGVSAFYGDYAIKYGPSGIFLTPKWKTALFCQYKSWFLHVDVMAVRSRIQEIDAMASGNVGMLVPRLAFGRHVQVNRWRFHPVLQVSPHPSLQTGIQLEI